MANRRVPLANNSNAVNSPFRTVAAVSGKRTRAQIGDARDAVFGQPPSKKQQLIDLTQDENTAPAAPRQLTRQSQAQQEAEAKIFMRKTTNAAPTAFERKLAAVREKKPPAQQKLDPRAQKQGDSLESIRQWQKHYKKAFPQYVFYFESVPDDVRIRVSRQIQFLGAVRTRLN